MENSSGIAKGAGNSYASLRTYNSGRDGFIVGPAPATVVPSMSVQLVPNYSAPGYKTLLHGEVAAGAGYFNIQGAYPDCGNGGTTFSQRLCGGN